jgi:hypothetical protein
MSACQVNIISLCNKVHLMLSTELNATDAFKQLEVILDFSAVSLSLDAGVEIELVFRSCLDKIVQSIQLNNSNSDLKQIEHLINLSIEYALKYGTSGDTKTAVVVEHSDNSLQIKSNIQTVISHLCKIPFLLMEDVLEGLAIDNLQIFWNYLECLVDRIRQPDLFGKGKMFEYLRLFSCFLEREFVRRKVGYFKSMQFIVETAFESVSC